MNPLYFSFIPAVLLTFGAYSFGHAAGLKHGRQPKPWKWSRSPGEPYWSVMGTRGMWIPAPPPMPAVQGMMYDLDMAAKHLSANVRSPQQVETMLLVVDHHLLKVRKLLAEEFERVQPKPESES